jgi:uncharacterized protein (TIGR02147 family)
MNYKSSRFIIKDYLASLGTLEKRGAHQSMAHALGIFPSYLSLILRGDRNLNLDQGMLLANHLELKKIERRYLMRVIELDRAQTKQLKEEIESELEEIRLSENQISKKVEREEFALSMDDSTRFFSSWAYSAIHLMAAITPILNPATVARKLKLDVTEVKGIFDFLIRTGLWKKEDRRIILGTNFIHLDHLSSLINHHHMNWRLKSITHHQSLDKEKELAYSLCVALSTEDALKIRSVLLKAIENIRKTSDPSPSEVLYNLNMDWLKVLGNE